MNFLKTAAIVILLSGLSTVIYAQERGFNINNDEIFVYSNIFSDDSEEPGRTRYFAVPGDESFFGYIHSDSRSEWRVYSDEKGFPTEISYSASDNALFFEFDGSGNVRMHGVWDEKTVDITKKFKNNVTLENAAVVRTLDFDSGDKYVFDLLQTDKLPRLIAYRMYFKVLGTETVTVKAGTFRCRKILFTLTDWRTLFYKAYYYITDDDKRCIVKIDNVPEGGSSELISIE